MSDCRDLSLFMPMAASQYHWHYLWAIWRGDMQTGVVTSFCLWLDTTMNTARFYRPFADRRSKSANAAFNAPLTDDDLQYGGGVGGVIAPSPDRRAAG